MAGKYPELEKVIGVTIVKLTHDKQKALIKIAWPRWPKVEEMVIEFLKTKGNQLHGTEPRGPGPRAILTQMEALHMLPGQQPGAAAGAAGA